MAKSEVEPLADRLRRLRLARGLSQRALGRAAGLAETTVGHLEAGRRVRPDVETLEKLAGALDVEPRELAGW